MSARKRRMYAAATDILERDPSWGVTHVMARCVNVYGLSAREQSVVYRYVRMAGNA